MKKPAKRCRKATNLTLSKLVKKAGPDLAQERGTSFSGLVENLLRTELGKAGKLPPGSALCEGEPSL